MRLLILVKGKQTQKTLINTKQRVFSYTLCQLSEIILESLLLFNIVRDLGFRVKE